MFLVSGLSFPKDGDHRAVCWLISDYRAALCVCVCVVGGVGRAAVVAELDGRVCGGAVDVHAGAAQSVSSDA